MECLGGDYARGEGGRGKVAMYGGYPGNYMVFCVLADVEVT